MREFVAWAAVYFFTGVVFAVVEAVEMLVTRFLFKNKEYNVGTILLYSVFTFFLWPLQLFTFVTALLFPRFYAYVSKSMLRKVEQWSAPFFAYSFDHEPSQQEIQEVAQHIWRTNPGWMLGDPIDMYLYREKKTGKTLIGFVRKDKCYSHKCFRHVRASDPVKPKFEEVWNAS